MLIACRDCATIQRLPPAPARGRLECRQCGRVLENNVGRSLDFALACSITTLLLLLPANLMRVMTVSTAGISVSSHLASDLATAWRRSV
jgi:paraquat-inducible protein A